MRLMTQKEIDTKIFEMRMYIADKFRDIQMQSQSLKNVEDEVRVKQTLVKISDFVNEIQSAYRELSDLQCEEADEPEEEDSFCQQFSSYM